jgi:hypothetical protein
MERVIERVVRLSNVQSIHRGEYQAKLECSMSKGDNKNRKMDDVKKKVGITLLLKRLVAYCIKTKRWRF